ncbi:hypothetical protein HUU40_31285, partial [candidate division KSB1 bacterium]|nr:hypothetical protein [candidate division KSB1 bacterium]
MATAKNVTACCGCQALVPDIDGPSHPYLGASPGCWAIYGEVLAKEYGEYRYPAVHRLTVDAYAAQHPGVPSRQAIQSVAVHLISLFLLSERRFAIAKMTEAMRGALRHRDHFVWLAPLASLANMTILDVTRAQSLQEHSRCVQAWAESVWQAWSPHHATIRRWAHSSQRMAIG